MKRITLKVADWTLPLSPLAFGALAEHLSGQATSQQHLNEAIQAIAGLKRRMEAQAEKRKSASSLWDRLLERSGGVCECGCGRAFGEGLESCPTMDHWYGRAKAPENEETCWLLRWGCHDDKGNSRPFRAKWQRKWDAHQERLRKRGGP